MRSPFLLPTVALIAGIWLENIWNAGIPLLFFYSLLSLVFLLHKTLTHIALYSLFFFSGALLLAAHESSHAIRVLDQLNDTQCTIIAVVHDDEKNRDIIDVRAHPTTIRCTLPYKSNLEVGDEILLPYAPLKVPHGGYACYLHRAGITLTAKPFLAAIKLVHRPSFSLSRAREHLKEQVHHAIVSALSGVAAHLGDTLFFGKRAQESDLKDQFLFSGASHLLARSGLHVTLVLLVVHYLSTILFFPSRLRQLLLLLFILIYGILTEMGISFLRGVMVYCLYGYGTLSGRKASLEHLLTVTCLSMLLVNPYHIFFLDFQLTFTITFALIAFFQKDSHVKKKDFLARVS